METLSTTATDPSNPNPTGVRNTFLTVICILSFIGSGWGIQKAIRSYATANTVANVADGAMKNAEQQMDQQNTPDFAKQIMSSITDNLTPENIRKASILEFISNLFTLFGAILMWNLKKIGFYLYIAGIAVLVASPLIMGKFIGIIGGIIVGLIGMVFIIMYGVNLKYMDK